MYYILSLERSEFFKETVPSVLFAEEDLISISYDLHTLGVEVSIPDLEKTFYGAAKRRTVKEGRYFVEYVAAGEDA